MQFELGKHRGKYVAVYQDNGVRKRRSLGTDNETVARSRLAEIEHNLKRRELSRGHTVNDILNKYLEYHTLRKSPSTNTINKHFKELQVTFGHLLPSDLSDDRVRAYVNGCLTVLSPNTVALRIAFFRAALNWSRKTGILKDVPWLYMPKKGRPKDHYLNRLQVERLLVCAEAPHLKLFIILAVATAARSNAILDLTWDRVNLDSKIIDFNNPAKPLGKKRAVVPINDTLHRALTEANKYHVSPYVIEYRGQRLKQIMSAMAALSKLSGIKVTAHMLRHTSAVWMAEAGIPMSEISQYLGHSSTAITERVYARYSPHYLRKAASALELSV